MDLRAPVSSVSLFKETRTDVEPLTPGSVIQIQVPSTSTFTVRRKQRHFLKTLPDYKDENEYVKHCLASSTSLYFGKSKRHPRCFLWRVLQDFKVLELRSVDLSKIGDETREASFSIQLCFSTAIKYGGVALAESADKDILNVFVLTRGNELYTFAVRKGFFCHASASEEDISRWCKAAKPATFSISTPHGLTSASPLQLIVSLSDGRILQLTRGKDEDGSKWHESTYGDGKWASSLRGLVRWQGSNTVKYDGTTLEQGTPTAIAVSPDKKHIFAVCLDHTLRIWNLNNATSVYSKDLLWQRREPHDIPKLMLDPSSRNVLQLFKIDLRIDGIEYYAVTFSPQDFGQFKFWGVRDPDHGEQGVCDLFPDYVLKPPDPDPSPESKAIWKATDFKIIGGQHGKELAMWVLMRSSREYMLYHLKFDLEDLPNVWRDSWSSTAFETLHNSPPPQISDFDPEDVTESWLNHILHNSRYPASVIEMGLKIYCSQRSLSECEAKASLRQRMCSAVASQVRSVYVVNDFNMYRIATYQEWTILWQDIRDLNRLGWEVMSLAIDEHVELPWLAFANGCSAIRTCDDVEIIAQNSPTNLAVSNNLLRAPSIETDYGIEPKLPDELAAIVETAATFRQSFSYILRKTCDTVLATELWLDPSYSVPLRIQSVYDRCNFADEIGPSSFDNLINGLERIGGFDGLETHTFLAILKYFSHDLRNTSSGLIHTMFGLKVIINGAREMIELRERLLFDLLVLIVFIDVEIDREETPMENLDASQIYVEMLDLLKQYQTMQWLVKNTRAAKSDVFGYSVPTIGDDNSSINNAIPQTWTILESIFTFYLTPQSFEAQTQSDALTETIHDLFKFATGGQGTRLAVDDVAVYVQCNLLVKGNIDLASEFLQYQPSTAWATYIRGRFSLLNGDFTEAAIYFKKASYKLSRPLTMDYHLASHSLLSPMEAIHFGHGLPAYYNHILNLFDYFSCPAQMADFAHIALQVTPSHPPSDQSMTLLSSLFQASLQTTDFPTAYSALTRHPAPETLLPSFVQALLSTPNALPQLLALPFPPNLHSEIDALLASHKNCPKILAAWRIHHQDFRGAAAALLPPLQAAQAQMKRGGEDLENDYLAIINLLACAGNGHRWVLSEGDVKGMTGGKVKRKVVTIEDVRAQYQKELDRRSVIEGGNYTFGGGGDEMDVL